MISANGPLFWPLPWRAVVASVGGVLASCEASVAGDVDETVDPVDELRACARDVSIATARLLSAVVRVADQAKPGFDADEVAFALAWTQSAARSQVEFGRYLIHTLPAVFGAAYRILGTVADAEDVTQEVWLRAADADLEGPASGDTPTTRPVVHTSADQPSADRWRPGWKVG